MRLRLWSKVKKQLKPRTTKGLICLIAGGIVVVVVVGGGAYAAIFGGFNGAGQSSTVNLQKGLVGWWKLNGNTNDSTPYRLNGTAVGGPTLTTDREGATNGAYSFNGSSQYINLPTSVIQTGAYTKSAWIKLASTSGNNNIFSGSGGCGGSPFWAPGGTLYAGQCSNYNYVGGGAMAVGVWYFVAVTFDPSVGSGTMRLYKNNTLMATATNVATQTDTSLQIAGFGGGNTFNGAISDARLYNRALSATEITALGSEYNAQVNAGSGEQGLVGWWKMDGNANDSSPYRNGGTLIGSPSLTADREGASNSAYSLNGTSQYISFASPPMSSSFTYTGWFKLNSFPSAWGAVFGDWRYTNPPAGVDLIPRSGGVAICAGNNTGTYSAATNCTTTFSSTAVQTGKWIHGALTYDGTTLTAYINGQSIGSVSIAITHNSTTFTAGRWSSAYGGYYMDGSVDDIRIYNRALSAQQIAAIANSYNSQINLNSSPTNQSTVNLNSGLVGYWNFNGNAVDSTPYRQNGTVTGASLTADRKGRANSAYSFNGSGSTYITTNPISAVSRLKDYTISTWMYLNDNTSIQTIIEASPSCTDRNGISLQSGTISLGSYNGTAWAAASGPINTGQWHLVTGENSGGTPKLYIDGVLQSGTVAHYESCSSLVIGKAGTQPYYFNGYLDDLRIYNRALSTTEVTAL